ncbi:hypothetical protein JG688_00012972 [Phytophthora aleatoria]|uniref:Uncharacterized protein n=1 Tax=Phytophthora aleatoria TaxID=2496075 RepID=A0A8J5M4B6_9STRA|nr:hypothetical protein JG688_00012972 [Phytophthora aleatoria]
MPAENGDEEISDDVLTEAKGASVDPIGMDVIKEADGGGGGGVEDEGPEGYLEEELQRFCASGGRNGESECEEERSVGKAEEPGFDDAAVELEVCNNIVLSLQVEGAAAMVTVDVLSPVRPSRRVIRGETMKGIAREAVYLMLKEGKDGSTKTEGTAEG